MPLLRALLLVGPAPALAAPAAAEGARGKRFYVSLGDSYATGFQATGAGQGVNTRNGFPYQVPRRARRRGHRLALVNFACAGETTASLLARTTRCGLRTPGGADYAGRTQLAAASRFLRRHRGEVALITVSIGGNDVTPCAREADPIACVGPAVQRLRANVATIARRLRRVAGPKPRIVGTTYPDALLGQWVGADASQGLARDSVPAFQLLINPALAAAYAAAGGRFVDVTAATGAYGSLDVLPPGEVVPAPVAEVCRLTYSCDFRDVHARTSGYTLIARLVAGSLPRRRGG